MKIGIIGSGNVGSTVAYHLMGQGLCNEIVLVDKNEKLAYAQALDLSHCNKFLEKTCDIYMGRYIDVGDADIVILAAAAPFQIGQTRLDMAEESGCIIKDMIPQIMQENFNGIFIVITNPVDVISYFVYQLSGLPTNKIIGTGTALDTARLHKALSDMLKIDMENIQAYVIGEHGDSQLIPWSHVRIKGMPIKKYCLQNNIINYVANLEEISKKVIRSGWEIAEVKKTTNYGISYVTSNIIKAIVKNTNVTMPVSTWIYEDNIFAGMPAIINKDGVRQIEKFSMTKEEENKLFQSFKIIQSIINTSFLNNKYQFPTE